jgi:hypothetical protein
MYHAQPPAYSAAFLQLLLQCTSASAASARESQKVISIARSTPETEASAQGH